VAAEKLHPMRIVLEIEVPFKSHINLLTGGGGGGGGGEKKKILFPKNAKHKRGL